MCRNPLRTLSRLGRAVAIAAFAQIVCAASAGALTIGASDVPDGVSSATVSGVVFESSPRVFSHKSKPGFTGLGVKNGYVDGEVDLKGESLTIRFAEPLVLDQLVLGFLFKKGNFGDVVSEVARVRAVTADGHTVVGDLAVLTGTTASWSGPGGGPVTNVSPGTNAGNGVWAIADPFGDLAIRQLRLSAVKIGCKDGSSNSDFAFGSLTASAPVPVPEPGTLALLGCGLAGLAATRRRS